MPIAFMIARQRSGTGALGSILHQHPEIIPTGEVFHPNGIGKGDKNYFTFLQVELAKDPGLALPDRAAERFDRYLDYLETKFKKKWILIDVKYRSLGHFNGFWQSAGEAPAMLSLIKERGLKILHLVRYNTLEAWVSGRIAEENQTWHAQGSDQIKKTKVYVDPEAVRHFIALSQREQQALKLALETYEQTTTVEYKRLFKSNGQLTDYAHNKIQNLFQLSEPIPFKAALVKQAPRSVREAITNLSEIENLLEETQHAWMLGPKKD